VSDEVEVAPSSIDNEKLGLNTEQKAEIIFDFINKYRSDEAFDEFFSYNDLGVPMAVMIVNELVTLTEKGLQVINETWEDLCENLNYADPEYDYESLDELIEKAVPFENELEEE
jgi:hypothetical protein